jgi:hypothetical protein
VVFIGASVVFMHQLIACVSVPGRKILAYYFVKVGVVATSTQSVYLLAVAAAVSAILKLLTWNWHHKNINYFHKLTN